MPRRRSSDLDILVWLNTAVSHEREIMKGIAAVSLEHPTWQLYQAHANDRTMPTPARGRWDGVLGFIVPSQAARFESMRSPIVNTSDTAAIPRAHIVTADNEQAGRLAARYLIDRGHRRFAFIEHGPFRFSTIRHHGFASEIEDAGLEPPRAVTRQRVLTDRRRRWLRDLGRPVGVFAATDDMALHFERSCRLEGVVVPDDAALVGVNDDDLVCSFMRPTLSSVNLRWAEVGRRAAQVLGALMQGDGETPEIHVPPLGVVPRGSAETMTAIGDEQVADAVRYIRAHADKPLSVDEVVAEVGGSRRRLEYGFKRHLGRTPHSEILRAHLDLAKRLLAGTDLPITQIAFKAGFSDARHFSTMFRKHEGMPPRSFRLMHSG